HALLKNALQRAQSSPLYQQNATRISLIAGNASEAMEEAAKERQQSDDSCHESLTVSLRNSMQSAHAIYLDPMYPSRKKRAEVSKGMQMLHRLVGPADPAQSHRLLAAALNLQVARVVVKRPRSSSVLEGTERWSGQRTDIVYPNTRYDIYHKN
ncbi:MAG: class I SAM-dependent methyltransferase, partial [Granulosicoccus sp.]|nr:class I SAM-dependent methyltransferase [Granulosicoccus sp.]